MTTRPQVPSLLVSILINGAVLLAMYLYKLPAQLVDEVLAIDSIVEPEDREQDQFVQELETDELAAETANLISGGATEAVGGNARPIQAQHKLEPQTKLDNLRAEINVSSVHMPAVTELGDDLGEEQVTGEVGALVPGYGPALKQMTQELIRLMRSDRLLVVWLFDESGSMKDDQQEIKEHIAQVYRELQLIGDDPERPGLSKRRLSAAKNSNRDAVLLTAITSFGRHYHPLMKSPSADMHELMAAIDRIPVDETGDENTCQALLQVMTDYRGVASGGRRKLVLIVVSDESGDDGPAVENVVRQARLLKVPIYVLGREAVFGSHYAHVQWRQPETGRLFYLPIRRGPETPFAEQLQFDGFRRRRDSQMSGFGPYEQVRLAMTTGGIFFQLPHEEEDLNDYDARRFEKLALREYLPNLEARPRYALERNGSPFRKAVWDVIAMLNPYDERNEGIELPDPAYEREWFTTDPADFGPKLRERGQKVLALLDLMKRAIGRLDKVRPARATESSVRWRANYDLISAQLRWYQIRLFEYGIGMDQFVKYRLRQRLAENPRHNRWRIRETGSKLVLPNAEQQKLFSITPEDLKNSHQNALALLAAVQDEHPGTPWARRAEWEMRRPVGVEFHTYYQAPPKPSKSKPQPKPTPPPKL